MVPPVISALGRPSEAGGTSLGLMELVQPVYLKRNTNKVLRPRGEIASSIVGLSPPLHREISLCLSCAAAWMGVGLQEVPRRRSGMG